MSFTKGVTGLISRSFNQLKYATNLALDARKGYQHFSSDKDHIMMKASRVLGNNEVSSDVQELSGDDLDGLNHAKEKMSLTEMCRQAAVLFVGTIVLSLSSLVIAVTLPLLVPSLILTGKLGTFVNRLKVASELVNGFYHYIVSPNSESIASIIRMNRAEYIHVLDWCNLITPEIASEVLGLAIQTNKDAVIERLLNRCGDRVNVRDGNGNTPLMIAVQHNHSIFNHLLENGAEIDAQNNSGETALVLAVNGHNDDMARELLDRGARVDLLDQQGENITQLALEAAIQYFQDADEHGEADFKALLCRVEDQFGIRENTQVSMMEECQDAAAVIFYRPLTVIPRVLWSLASDGFRRASTYLKTA